MRLLDQSKTLHITVVNKLICYDQHSKIQIRVYTTVLNFFSPNCKTLDKQTVTLKTIQPLYSTLIENISHLLYNCIDKHKNNHLKSSARKRNILFGCFLWWWVEGRKTLPVLWALAMFGEPSMMSRQNNITCFTASTAIITNNGCDPVCTHIQHTLITDFVEHKNQHIIDIANCRISL